MKLQRYLTKKLVTTISMLWCTIVPGKLPWYMQTVWVSTLQRGIHSRLLIYRETHRGVWKFLNLIRIIRTLPIDSWTIRYRSSHRWSPTKNILYTHRFLDFRNRCNFSLTHSVSFLHFFPKLQEKRVSKFDKKEIDHFPNSELYKRNFLQNFTRFYVFCKTWKCNVTDYSGSCIQVSENPQES